MSCCPVGDRYRSNRPFCTPANSQRFVRFFLWLIVGLLLSSLLLVYYVEFFSSHTQANAVTLVASFFLFTFWNFAFWNGLVAQPGTISLGLFAFTTVSFLVMTTIIHNVQPEKPTVPTKPPPPNLGTCTYYDEPVSDICPHMKQYIGAQPHSFSCSNGNLALYNSSVGLMDRTSVDIGVMYSFMGIMDYAGSLYQDLAEAFDSPMWTPEQAARCQVDMADLLCATFFPPCDATCQPFLPCSSVCQRVRSDSSCALLTKPEVANLLLPGGMYRQIVEGNFAGAPLPLQAVDIFFKTVLHCGTGTPTGTSSKNVCGDSNPQSTTGARVRLAESGRLEVLIDGEWGTVDASSIGSTSEGDMLAAVVCRELDLGAGSYVDFQFTKQGSTPRILKFSGPGSLCLGTESSLAECETLAFDASLTLHERDIGVQCEKDMRSPGFGSEPYCSASPPIQQARVDGVTDGSQPNCDLETYRSYLSGGGADNDVEYANALKHYNDALQEQDRWFMGEKTLSVILMAIVMMGLLWEFAHEMTGVDSLYCCRRLIYRAKVAPTIVVRPQSRVTGDVELTSGGSEKGMETGTPGGDSDGDGDAAGFRELMKETLWEIRTRIGLRVLFMSMLEILIGGTMFSVGYDQSSDWGYAIVFHLCCTISFYIALRPICFPQAIYDELYEQQLKRYQQNGPPQTHRPKTAGASKRPRWSRYRDKGKAALNFQDWWLYKFYEENFGLDGRYFYTKQHFIEALDFTIQAQSLVRVADHTDSWHLFAYGAAMSLNVFFTPLMSLSSNPTWKRDIPAVVDVATECFYLIYLLLEYGSTDLSFSQALALFSPALFAGVRLYELSAHVLKLNAIKLHQHEQQLADEEERKYREANPPNPSPSPISNPSASPAHRTSGSVAFSPKPVHQTTHHHNPGNLQVNTSLAPSSPHHKIKPKIPAASVSPLASSSPPADPSLAWVAHRLDGPNRSHSPSKGRSGSPHPDSPSRMRGIYRPYQLRVTVPCSDSSDESPAHRNDGTDSIGGLDIDKPYVHHSRREWVFERAIVTLFCVLGLTLFTYLLASILVQEGRCKDEVGSDVWSRTSPKIYFPNGLFGATDCDYESVSWLDLEGVSLQSLHRSLLNYHVLEDLNIRNTKLLELPEFLSELPMLRVLDARDNAISGISLWLTHYWSSQLSSLRLDGNPVASHINWDDMNVDELGLPLILSNLTATLTSISLRNNNLTSIPAFLYTMSNLEAIDFSHNGIDSVNADLIDAFPQMRLLNMSHNLVTSFPVRFPLSRWDALELIDFSHNVLTSVHAEFSKIPVTAALNLRGNPATSVVWSGTTLEAARPEICDMEHVTTLEIDKASLKALPDLSACALVTYVYMPTNLFTSLPETLTTLTRTTELLLHENAIATIPDSVGALTQLTALNLRRNRITTLPSSFANLLQLDTLLLTTNQISAMPPEIISLFVNGNLKLLEIHDNPGVFTAAQVQAMLGTGHVCVDNFLGGARRGIACNMPCHASMVPGTYHLSPGDSGTIRSDQGANGLYPKLQNCEWTLVPPAGYGVEVKFIDFDLESADTTISRSCVNDHFLLDNGESALTMCSSYFHTGQYQSMFAPPPGYPFLSNNTRMYLEFRVDQSSERPGFELAYQVVPV